MPISTSAYCIIPTSLPPFPTAAVCFLRYILMPSVIIDFCVGEHRQQITKGAFEVTVKNRLESASNSVFKLIPSITITSYCNNSSFRFSVDSCYFMTKTSCCRDRSLAEIAAHCAVSNLSLVNIHM